MLVWSWFSDPFGTDAANENPAGIGTFKYNLRFAGQVFDGQAGLHYNYLRDYDPATGRYPESDPLELGGGSYSTYAYVHGDPISRIEPLGLDDTVCMFNPTMCGMPGGSAPNAPPPVAQVLIGGVATDLAVVAPEVLNALKALQQALSQPPNGLPPPGTKPPVEHPEQCEVGPSTRGSGSSLWDSNGGEWRYAPGDKWHNPHWDYNPWNTWNAPWTNVPIGNLPPVKP
jgi:RHS repeat-associated protein